MLARQLGAGIERSRLRRAVEDAAALAATDRLRTALLRAVSHDLRTPLSSIKASVSSLLASDVSLSEAESAELLGVVDSEADRLDRLVGNLLDMSRLDAGAVEPRIEAGALEEVVAVVLSSRRRLGPARRRSTSTRLCPGSAGRFRSRSSAHSRT